MTCPNTLTSAPPELPGVDGGSVLDALHGIAGGRGIDRSVQRGDHTAGEGVGELHAAGIADGVHGIAHRQLVGIADLRQ